MRLTLNGRMCFPRRSRTTCQILSRTASPRTAPASMTLTTQFLALPRYKALSIKRAWEALLWTLTAWLPRASLGCLGLSLFICTLRAQSQAHSRHREPQMASRQQLVVGVLHLRDDVFVSSGSETATTWPIRRGRAALIAARLATSAANTRSVQRLAEVAPTVLRGRLRRQRALPGRTAQSRMPRRTTRASTAVLGRSAQRGRSNPRSALSEPTATSPGWRSATHVLQACFRG